MSKVVDVNEKYNKTIGTVTKVYKCWWIKVNQKAVRMHALDGAAFPHIITVEYQAYGEKYTKKMWLGHHITCPVAGSTIPVYYEKEMPKKICIGI